MISLQQINYILTLAETKHFQRASEKCFVTQPTLSMQLKKAEEDLGFEIFDRNTKELTLTFFGEKLIPILRDIENEVIKIDKLVQVSKGTYQEVIRIGVIPTISAYLISDMFLEWKKTVNNAQIIIKELKSEDLILALEKKEIDLGIMAGPFHENTYRTIPIFKEEIKAYINEQKDEFVFTNTLSELHPWLLSQGNCLRTQMIHFCNLKEEQNDDWDYEGGNIDILIDMVDKNGGYTLIPKEYEKRLKSNSQNVKRIFSTNKKEVPAREVIAVAHNRNTKWKNLEKLIRSMQLYYNSHSNETNEFNILSWR